MKTNQKQKNIPDGWKTKTLDEVCVKKGLVRGPFGGALKKEFFADTGFKVYEQKNAIYSSVDLGSYYIDEEKFQELKRFSVKPDDFIISCSGTIGKIYRVPEGAPAGVINQALLKITIDESVVNHSFFYSHFTLPKFQSLVIDNTQGGAMQNLVGMDIFRATKVLLPPLPEQKRIVAVLETWDEAIEKLKRKIAIKKEIKKGLMQNLLTGKKRLPGFSGEWEELKLKDVAICLDNKRIPLNSEDRSKMQGNIPYCGANNIVDYINDYIFNEDIILVAEDGGQFDEYQNRPIAYRVFGKSWVNNHAHVIKANDENSQDFLFYSTVHKNVLMYLNGGTRAKLNKSELLSIKYKVPEIKEQKAIAQILATADDEITTLEEKLALWQEQKRYLLNNLVTGQMRTPEDLKISL